MSGIELKHRGVLITRALAQSQALKQMVEARGGRAFLFPALEIQLTSPPKIKATLARVCAGDMLVFVSTNAVAGVFNNISSTLRGQLIDCRIAAVGARTCQALQAEGMEVEIQAPADQQNSEGLLAHPDLQVLAGQQIWIIRGQSGRELLRDALRQHGADVDYVQAYQTSAPAEYDAEPLLAALRSGQIQLVMLTSYGVFSNLLQMLGEQAVPLLQSTQLIVPGQRVAKKILSDYDLSISVAENASDQAMLACAKKLGGKPGSEHTF